MAMTSTLKQLDEKKATQGLKPCPFCGKEAKRLSDGNGVKIGCKDLGCAGYLLTATSTEWNRRAARGEDK